jgi:periplasmic copper chaperone A
MRWRVTTAGLGALAFVVAMAAPAFAHVEVQPGSAASGAPAAFAFRVPNEKDTAATVALAVHFRTDRVITVDVAPKSGWTVQVTMKGDTVDTITWSGGRIEPGHADYFAVNTGPLPTDVAELTFSADQTYSDGDVVTWNQPEVAGHGEPAHPAPVLQLTGALAPASTAAAAPAVTNPPGSPAPIQAAAPATTAAEDDDGGPPAGVIAAAAAAAFVVAVGGLVMLRRSPGRRSAPQ